MTSVKNVMAIASHLQFLESSLSNILIEAALKLTTLTDSSIFILIDGPNGRKYAGTELLTDTFKKEGLVVENGDAEMNIEGGWFYVFKKCRERGVRREFLPSVCCSMLIWIILYCTIIFNCICTTSSCVYMNRTV